MPALVESSIAKLKLPASSPISINPPANAPQSRWSRPGRMARKTGPSPALNRWCGVDSVQRASGVAIVSCFSGYWCTGTRRSEPNEWQPLLEADTPDQHAAQPTPNRGVASSPQQPQRWVAAQSIDFPPALRPFHAVGLKTRSVLAAATMVSNSSVDMQAAGWPGASQPCLAVGCSTPSMWRPRVARPRLLWESLERSLKPVLDPIFHQQHTMPPHNR